MEHSDSESEVAKVNHPLLISGSCEISPDIEASARHCIQHAAPRSDDGVYFIVMVGDEQQLRA